MKTATAIQPTSFLPTETLGKLRKMSNQAIGDFIAARLKGIRDSLVELAAAVLVAEEKGVDIDQIPAQMLTILRRIAYGQVDPDLVSRYEFSRSAYKLSTLTALPLPDQRRCASGDKFEVAVASGDVASMTVDDMTRDQFFNVFREGRILSPTEQKAEMGSKLLTTQISNAKPAYTVDAKNGNLIINRAVVLTKRDLEKLLSDLSR